MRISKVLFLLLVATMGLLSCQKDEANGLPGTWEGSWGFGNAADDYLESWVLDKNGTFNAYDDDGDLYASGTWSLDGVEFEAEYTSTILSNSYSFSGQYNDAQNEILGTWGDTPSVTDGGEFEMYKK